MKLSIIICTYNRANLLPYSLKSMADQDADRSDFEVIVVNNNSTDRTLPLCGEFEQENPGLNFRHIMERRQGLSIARNTGIAGSKGDIIAFIDDDATAEKDFARNIITDFEQFPDYETMGGKVLPVYPDSTEPVWMSKYIEGVVSKVDYGNNFSDFYRKKYPVGCNMIFRRSLFDEIGVLNEDLKFRSDDKFIFLKVRNQNKRILYAPNIIVHHIIDESRLSYDFIRKLCVQIGGTERIRLKSSYA